MIFKEIREYYFNPATWSKVALIYKTFEKKLSVRRRVMKESDMHRSSNSHALIGVVILLMGEALALVSRADEMTARATNAAGAQATVGAPAATNTAATNAPAANVPSPATTLPIPDANSLYALTVKSLDGKPVDLRQYMGQVALVINTASKSGHAEQFAGLEKLYETYKDRGFVILDFPSNDFGQLEPGTPQEITDRYAAFKLTFPILEMVKIRGAGQSPVYHLLTTGHSMPTWSFHKFLVDKTGKVIQEFPSQTKPDDKDLQKAIEAALK